MATEAPLLVVGGYDATNILKHDDADESVVDKVVFLLCKIWARASGSGLPLTQRPMQASNIKGVVFLFSAIALVVPVAAQVGAPSTQTMIEQLQAPRTRSLRNLLVEKVPTPIGTDSGASAGTGTTAPGEAAAGATSSAVGSPPSAPTDRPSLSLLIQFDFDSARVRPESHQALVNLSLALQSAELVASRFVVEGHTDAKGPTEYNLRLSEQRALAVRDFLKSRGVAEERLVASGKGASELANSHDPFAAANRRVKIVNLD